MASAPLQDSVWLKLLRRCAAALYGTRPYAALVLPRRAPLELPVLPEDPWPGQPANADRLFQGRFIFAGIEVASPHSPPWSNPAIAAQQLQIDDAAFAAWAAELHSFAWLRDFASQGGDMARRMSRSLLVSWLERHPRIHGLPWQAEIAARRLVHWLSHAHFLLEKADDAFAHDFLLAIARHAAHLNVVARMKAATPGLPRLSVMLALAYAAECLPRDEADTRRKAEAIRALCAELERQVLADGGHATRNPAQVFAVLRDLVALWLFLRAADPERAGLLQPYLDRMAPMLRFFRHGDGGLALFHGGNEENAAQIDLVLEHSEAKGKPLASALLSRFERAAAKRALLILDAGAPPPATTGARPHRGLLAFEFSHGRDRLIVNCGAPRHPGQAGSAWTAALSGIAAHSTLMLGNAEPAWRAEVSVVRHEQDGAIWFELEHDGWAAALHGRKHRRRLYLAASGEDLRGEETVTAPTSAGAPPVDAVLRLHLHPSVHASLLGSGDTVILKSAGGQGWRLRAAGGVLRLEDSIYFGRGGNGARTDMSVHAAQGEARRSQQIVLTGSAGDSELVFKWALTKIG